jgi:hypothetical protein
MGRKESKWRRQRHCRIKAVNRGTFIEKRPVKTLRLKWTRSQCNNYEIHVGEAWFVHGRCCTHSELWTGSVHRQVFPAIRCRFISCSRKMDPYESARERSSFMLSMKRFDGQLNRPLARFLDSAEILTQKHENFFWIDSAVRSPNTSRTDYIPTLRHNPYQEI